MDVGYKLLYAMHMSRRTKALVLELLAAVCLVRGGHDIIISAFNNFKDVRPDTHTFTELFVLGHLIHLKCNVTHTNVTNKWINYC